jgi:sugar lactone lactonase YvrE
MDIKQLGKYTIHEVLGRGGFGTVYRATDNALDREVALKILHPQLMVDMDFIERFQKEARLVARLEHPNIVTIHDLGEAEGRVYIAMRYLPGGSLRDRLKKSGPIPFDQALEILRQAGAGLGAAHAKGIVHRDIKPENILFSEQGQAVISDFGLAKAIQASSSSSLGGVGTPGYRAPELWRGKPPAGPATDEYALACVFVEMLTGEQLFAGETPDEIITKHLVDGAALPPKWPAGVPQGVNAILEKALAKDPAARYPGVEGFVAALEGLEGEAARRKEDLARQAAEEQALQEQQANQKRAVEEQARLDAGERLRQEAEAKALQAAREQAQREAQERERKAREQRLAEIARLQPEIETALVGKEWSKAGQLLSQLKNQGPEGRAMADRMRKRLLKGRLPGWARGWRGLVVVGASLGVVVMGIILGVLFSSRGTHVAGTPYIPGPVVNGYFYFTSNEGGKTAIRFMDPKGNIKQVTPDGYASWSPAPTANGYLYFTSNEGGKTAIHFMDPKGNIKRVTPDGYASWSPTPTAGGYLYFTSNEGGKTAIHFMDPKGNIKRVTPDKYESWSPAPTADGYLYFTSNKSGKAAIYYMDLKGNIKQVTPDGYASWSPAPAANGYLYFTSNEGGRTAIHFMDPKGNIKQVTPDGYESWSPAPTAGGYLYFTSKKSGKAAIYYMDLEGNIKQVTPDGYASWGSSWKNEQGHVYEKTSIHP